MLGVRDGREEDPGWKVYLKKGLQIEERVAWIGC